MNNRYILLLRPSNFIITVASVFVSCLLAGGNSGQSFAMILASLAAGLIGGGGMVVNDIFDIEIDRVNKPARPLPSGVVSPRSAALFYALLTSVGLLLNLFLHSNAQVIAAAAAVLIFFYSYRLKSTPLFGNVTVGLLTGMAFIYGGAAVGNIGRAVIPALFAFLINVGREIIKDMEDVEGDALHHAETFPVKYGMKSALIAATMFLLAVVVSTIIPFASHQYGIIYFLIVIVGVDCVIAFAIFSMWNDVSQKNLNRLSTIIKYDMCIGLIAIYLG
jgi:geranylgeranylglycerol-phosphate geranylgeranyltransferase